MRRLWYSLQCACQSSPPDRPRRACAVGGDAQLGHAQKSKTADEKIPKQVKNNLNSSGKRPNMAGEEEDMGSLLMDIADGDLFNLFSEEWAMEMEMGLENEAESDGRDGRQDGFFAETGPNLLGTEPLESTDPIETMMGAYGITPLSPQGQPPSRHGQPPSRHGYPPSRHGYPPPQPEQPTTARFPAPARTVAIQHCRRLSVYPFLPEWPGQAAANSDRLYGRISSRDMVSREGGEKKKKKKKKKKKGGGGKSPCMLLSALQG